MRIRLGAGTGVEQLMAAMAVADKDWRVVLSHGETAYATALAAGGRELVRDAGRIGRHGWVHLLGPLTRLRRAWSVDALRTELVRLPAETLHEILIGRRGQATTWLTSSASPDVRSVCLGVLGTLPAPADRAPALSHVRARLAEVGPAAAAGRGGARAALRSRRARRRRAGDLDPGGADRRRARPSPIAP